MKRTFRKLNQANLKVQIFKLPLLSYAGRLPGDHMTRRNFVLQLPTYHHAPVVPFGLLLKRL